jgi:hypothetical protein
MFLIDKYVQHIIKNTLKLAVNINEKRNKTVYESDVLFIDACIHYNKF